MTITYLLLIRAQTISWNLMVPQCLRTHPVRYGRRHSVCSDAHLMLFSSNQHAQKGGGHTPVAIGQTRVPFWVGGCHGDLAPALGFVMFRQAYMLTCTQNPSIRQPCTLTRTRAHTHTCTCTREHVHIVARWQ